MYLHEIYILASRKCRSPKVPKNGQKIGNNYSVGQSVAYSCDTGFVLQGAAVIECLKNKTWNEAAPLCKGKNDNDNNTNNKNDPQTSNHNYNKQER